MFWGYPFYSFYIKSNQNRGEIAANLIDITYLSDANYQKTQGDKIFYGNVSRIDFEVESISKQINVSNFVSGQLLGAEEEIYLKGRLSGFKSKRIFILFLSILFTSLGFLIYYCLQAPHGFNYPEEFYQIYGYNHSEFLYNLGTPIALIIEGIIIVMLIIITIKYRNFKSSIKPTLKLLCKKLEAQTVTKFEVPLLFR